MPPLLSFEQQLSMLSLFTSFTNAAPILRWSKAIFWHLSLLEVFDGSTISALKRTGFKRLEISGAVPEDLQFFKFIGEWMFPMIIKINYPQCWKSKSRLMQGMSKSGLSLEVPHSPVINLAQWQWIKQILDFSDQVRNINLKTLSNVSLSSSYLKAEGGTDGNAENISGFTHAHDQISWFPNPQPALEASLCCAWQTLQLVAAWNNPGLWHSLR